jgi:hypothetical protein
MRIGAGGAGGCADALGIYAPGAAGEGDPPGKLLDPPGRSLDPPGRTLDPPGRSLTPRGRTLDPRGRSRTPRRRLLDPPGRSPSGPGNFVPPARRTRSPPGGTRSRAGRRGDPGVFFLIARVFFVTARVFLLDDRVFSRAAADNRAGRAVTGGGPPSRRCGGRGSAVAAVRRAGAEARRGVRGGHVVGPWETRGVPGAGSVRALAAPTRGAFEGVVRVFAASNAVPSRIICRTRSPRKHPGGAGRGAAGAYNNGRWRGPSRQLRRPARIRVMRRRCR